MFIYIHYSLNFHIFIFKEMAELIAQILNTTAFKKSDLKNSSLRNLYLEN